ncbi:MAG: DUF1704 domain-containing protein [Pedobacter sp.]|nr:MAG: DUF1704 domain-containing protein [Pedobacter sp.]
MDTIAEIDPKLVDAICSSFENGKSIRRNLPMNSKLVMDQKLPYLCVYRFTGLADYHLSSLLKTQGAYLIVHASLNISHLLKQLIDTAIKDFKSYMIVEVWTNTAITGRNSIEIWNPSGKISATVKELEKGFSKLIPDTEVILIDSKQRHPDDFPPLLPLHEVKKSGTLLLGIAMPPVFSDSETRQEFPLFFRRVRRKFAKVIKLAAYEFVRVQSDNKFEHYLMLGKTRLDNIVRIADRSISAISEKMDFILRVTPVNSTEEWKKFQDNKFRKIPDFSYRLISLDPEIEKRKLYNVRLENIEHPTLAFLLREKRMELEKQLIMLEERGTSKFMHTSKSIFGRVQDDLKSAAAALLNDEFPNEDNDYETVGAVAFARAAEAELNKYRPYFPGLNLTVKIKDNVNGLIVSGPELSIGKDLFINKARMNALIQHEVGTHMLTYCNGHAQPLHLMYAGFADYEQTQEGIAVLSEFLVGGLDINRLKLLAARVMAVDSMVNGADFIETFDMLSRKYGFKEFTAYNISMRVHRGGGYTKDAIYLKGLMEILQFLQQGGEFAQLYGGKFALKHLPLVDELTHLGILQKPRLPAFLETAEAKEKLNDLKRGLKLKDLVTHTSATI